VLDPPRKAGPRLRDPLSAAVARAVRRRRRRLTAIRLERRCGYGKEYGYVPKLLSGWLCRSFK